MTAACGRSRKVSSSPSHHVEQLRGHVARLAPVAFDTTTERANPSLGVAETALLRKVNEKVNDGVLPNERYRELVRELLAHRTLSRRTTSSRSTSPTTTSVEFDGRYMASWKARKSPVVKPLRVPSVPMAAVP